MAATPEAIVEVIERVYLLIHSFQISIFNCDLFEKDWIVRLLQHLCHRVFKVTVKQRGPVLVMGGDEGLFGVGGGGRVYFKKHHDIWTFEHECSNFSYVRRSLSKILVTFPDHQTIRT